jgi:hypothetical protein
MVHARPVTENRVALVEHEVGRPLSMVGHESATTYNRRRYTTVEVYFAALNSRSPHHVPIPPPPPPPSERDARGPRPTPPPRPRNLPKYNYRIEAQAADTAYNVSPRGQHMARRDVQRHSAYTILPEPEGRMRLAPPSPSLRAHASNVALAMRGNTNRRRGNSAHLAAARGAQGNRYIG